MFLRGLERQSGRSGHELQLSVEPSLVHQAMQRILRFLQSQNAEGEFIHPSKVAFAVILHASKQRNEAISTPLMMVTHGQFAI